MTFSAYKSSSRLLPLPTWHFTCLQLAIKLACLTLYSYMLRLDLMGLATTPISQAQQFLSQCHLQTAQSRPARAASAARSGSRPASSARHPACKASTLEIQSHHFASVTEQRALQCPALASQIELALVSAWRPCLRSEDTHALSRPANFVTERAGMLLLAYDISQAHANVAASMQLTTLPRACILPHLHCRGSRGL